MAVSATATVVSYTGNGSTTSFAVTFPFQGTGSAAELEVVQRTIATGAEAVLSYTTHYTVTGGSGSTGTVVMASAPADTVQIHIRRTTTRTQTVDYTANDPFPADTHELALDRLAMGMHEIQEELDRSFKVSRTNSITTPEFVDDASTRASKLLGFSSDGNTLQATTGRVSTVSVSNVAVDGSGNSQSATVSFNDTTGALALGVPVGSTGAVGSTGSQGPDGVGGLPYTFSTTTTDSDPGAGQIRLNNGTLGSVSQIFIDDSTSASGNPDVSAFILTWDDSTQTSDRGQVTIVKKAAQQNFATYKISGTSTDASGYVKLAVTHVVSNGSFSNSDAVLVSFVRTGNAGSLDDPMTTRGDVIIRDSSNATARLAVGSANTVLTSDGTDPSYTQVATAMIADDAVSLAKMAGIARGKIIVGDASGNPAVIGPGTSGQALVSDGTDVAFGAVGGLKLLGTGTASGSASLAFTSLMSSTYTVYLMVVEALLPATNGAIAYLYLSEDNGSSYTTSDMRYIVPATFYAGSGSPSGNGGNSESSGANFWRLTGGALSNASNQGMSGHVWIFDTQNNSSLSRMRGSFVYSSDTTNNQLAADNVYGNTVSATDKDAIKIEMSSGNIASGKVKLYGVVST
jgi:hypothetical protein